MKVFYSPKRATTVDVIHPETGRGGYGGRTFAQIQTEYPDVVVIDSDEALKLTDEFWRSAPVEITREQFDEALNVLPPVAWEHGAGCESFKMSERLCGNITGIYARVGSRYFCMNDRIQMPHSEVIERCSTTAGA